MPVNAASAILAISGSPRKGGNTEILLQRVLAVTGGELVRVCDLRIAPCASCWACRRTGECAIRDDMQDLAGKMLNSRAIILGSPVYFNNVSAQLKTAMDRTWWMRGGLSSKIAGAVVVGRGYGSESALTAMNAFFLKHGMLPANRGVPAVGFEAGDVLKDTRALDDCAELGARIMELLRLIGRGL